MASGPAVTSPVEIRKITLGVRDFRDLPAKIEERFPDVAVVYAPDDDAIMRELADSDAYTGFYLTREQLRAAKNLKWCHAFSAGVEHWLDNGIADHDVILTNSSGVHAINIAEHVFALMLAFARSLPNLLKAQEEHSWRGREDTAPEVFELDGQTVAIVGTGDIGLAVAARAKAFGMRTIGVRRSTDKPAGENIDEQIPFAELGNRLGEIDHVVISLPMTDDTKGLFDAKMIRAMKPGSYLYNIGRGGIVDQDALIEALNEGHLGGAGLDVTTPEPLPADSPLWDAKNVIITAHTSGSTPRYEERAIKLFGDILQQLRDGEEPQNRVDVSAGY